MSRQNVQNSPMNTSLTVFLRMLIFFFRLHGATFCNVYSEVGYELVLGTTWFGYELVVGTSWSGYELVLVKTSSIAVIPRL